MKAAKTSKNLKEMPYPPQKKLLKRKEKSITSEDKCPNFTNLFRMPKINNSNLSNENKELNNEAWTTSRGNNKSIFAS